MGTVRLPLVLAAATGMQCGPTPQQIGEQVLLVAPLVFVLSLGVQWILLRMWQRRRPDVAISWRRNLLVAGALLVPAGLALAFGDRREDWLLAVWGFGSSYGAVLLIATRVFLSIDRPRAFQRSHLVPMVIFLVPAAALALGAGAPLSTHAEELFLWPGFLGWITGGLWLGLMVEAWLAGRRRD